MDLKKYTLTNCNLEWNTEIRLSRKTWIQNNRQRSALGSRYDQGSSASLSNKTIKQKVKFRWKYLAKMYGCVFVFFFIL